MQYRQNSLVFFMVLAFFLIENYSFGLGPTISIRSDPSKENSSYGGANNILKRHTDYIASSAIFICYGGIIPLGLFIAAESTNSTNYGHEYNRAKKLKDLIRASSNGYLDGTEAMLATRKSKSERKKVYKNSMKIFDNFFRSLEQKYSNKYKLNKEDVKSLIWRANKLGLLTCKSLINRVIKEDSFNPIMWIVFTGQLLDRVLKMEALLKERDEDFDRLRAKVVADETFKSIFMDAPSVPLKIVGPELVETVYNKIIDKIRELPDYTYDYNNEIELRNGFLDSEYEILMEEST